MIYQDLKTIYKSSALNKKMENRMALHFLEIL